MKLHHDPAGAPIHDDDETIAHALEEASVPTLMMSMIHLSGDERLLDGDVRPLGAYINEVQGYMSEEAKASVRTRALEIVKAYRDRGCTLPSPPSPATLNRMMSFLVASPVPAEYVPMMLEEMSLDGVDSRGVRFDEVAREARELFHVAVIGGGMSGVLSAIRLREAGIPFTVFEKNPAVGGTWYENTYPGCRVDIGNHFYCYSFEPNADWSHFFAAQPELQAYFERCIDEYGVRDRFRFGTEVLDASYDEGAATWRLRVRDFEGREEVVSAGAILSAVGQLNRPKLPEIEGVGRFRGPALHSAKWDHSLDLSGKRVAVIGSGASAFQLVPEIAKRAKRLTVFQRTAPWMFENPSYHRAVSDGKKWCLRHLPYYARWYRFLLFWPACDGLLPSLEIDPAWPHQDRSINETNEMVRQVFTEYITRQVGDDPELLRKVIPDYVPLATRTLQDDGAWLAALRRDDVDLVTDPIASITETGIRCANGDQHDVDVIVYATGFHANRFLWPMSITGRKGAVLAEQWGESPSAYLGITVPNFPNLFCLYGPGTNLAFGGRLIFHSECQVRYALGCIKAMLAFGKRAIEVRAAVHDAYEERLAARLAAMVWSHPTVKHSWYRNHEGRVTVLSPWRLLDYWSWTRAPALEDYDLS